MNDGEQEADYASGVVLGRAMGERPLFQTPRFIISFTRSKRLRTLRFEPTFRDFFRLECWDMAKSKVSVNAGAKPRRAFTDMQVIKMKRMFERLRSDSRDISALRSFRDGALYFLFRLGLAACSAWRLR